MERCLMNYNYVYIHVELNPAKVSKDGYYEICARDLERLDNVQLVEAPLMGKPKFVQTLFMLHNSRLINSKLKLPFRKLWYPHYFKLKFDDTKPLCFVVGAFYYPVEFYRYLKKRYPNAKFVKIHRDLMKFFPSWYPEYTEEFCNEIFDLSFSYDKNEAKRYGWQFFDEFESKIDIQPSKDYPLYDVFFAGKAKERLPKLLEVYNRLTKAGLTCRYYLTSVPEEQRTALEGVEYANKNMTYRQMLECSVNARCILEINQEGAVGYTSRFLEAVMFDRMLLTDNSYIKTSKFYSPDRICCFDSADQIDDKFISLIADKNYKIDYNYNGEFSPVHLIEQIDRTLTELYGK